MLLQKLLLSLAILLPVVLSLLAILLLLSASTGEGAGKEEGESAPSLADFVKHSQPAQTAAFDSAVLWGGGGFVKLENGAQSCARS